MEDWKIGILETVEQWLMIKVLPNIPPFHNSSLATRFAQDMLANLREIFRASAVSHTDA